MPGSGVDTRSLVPLLDIDALLALPSATSAANLSERAITRSKSAMLGIPDVDEGREFDRVLNLKIEEKDEVLDPMPSTRAVIM